MKKKQKPKLKKSDLVTSKKRFFDLLHRAIRPFSEEEGQKEKSHRHGENISKQTHSRNSEATED